MQPAPITGRPALLGSRLSTALRLRLLGYRPGALANAEGGQLVELMGHPYPGDDGAYYIPARTTPGDPLTLAALRIPDEALDVVRQTKGGP